MSPYLRAVKTTSGAPAVQIIHLSHRRSREIEHIGSVHEEVELNDRFMAKHVTNGLGDCRLRDLTAKDVPAFLEGPAAVDPIPQASPQDPPRFHHVVCVSNKTIAEDAGDRSPDRTQRLLSRAGCDASGAVGVVRRVAVAGLDAATRRRGCRRAGKTGREESGCVPSRDAGHCPGAHCHCRR
jgi:hypothetical protein